MPKRRVGIIGCGGIAGVHMELLANRPEAVELVAFADVREEAARLAAERYSGGQGWTTDYQELVSRELDGVLVCVPTFLHAEAAATALRAGKHVFCEKPLARTREQAQEIARAEKESGRRLQVGFVRRFDEEWLAFRDAIRAGKIGRPVTWQDVASRPGPGAAWFNRDEEGGGPFLDGCIHNIDFALYTFGAAEWAFTSGRTLGAGHTAIDTGTAILRFAAGDDLLLAWSWGLPPGCHGARIFEFLGPEGLLRWPQGGGTTPFVIDRGVGKEEVTFPVGALSAGYEKQMDEFLSVTRGETAPRAGLAEGIASLDAALAILESARTGRVTPATKG